MALSWVKQEIYRMQGLGISCPFIEHCYLNTDISITKPCRHAELVDTRGKLSMLCVRAC